MPRLTFLTETEQGEFDYPPILSVENRAIAFAMDDQLKKKIGKLRTPTNQVGYLLQHAYFKACKRFFLIARFRQEDVEYAARLLGLSLKKIKMVQYKEGILRGHKDAILVGFEYKSYGSQKDWVKQEVINRVERVVEPRTLFLEILHQLHCHNIEIPSYHTLSELITDHYIAYETNLLRTVASGLSKEQKAALDALLVISKKHTNGLLNQYKFIHQSTRPKAIQANIDIFSQIQQLFMSLLPVLEALSLTPQCCEYYATWVKKAKLSQIKQLPDGRKRYLYLIAFLQHQYYIRQDVFIDILLRSVQSTRNSVLHQLKLIDQLTRSERRSAVKHLTKTQQNYRTLIDDITEIARSTSLSVTIQLYLASSNYFFN